MSSYDVSSTAQSSRKNSIAPSSLYTNGSFLRPEDAIYSPPRRTNTSNATTTTTNGIAHKSRHDKQRGRSRSRRRKGTWKKLLWVKQSYPDNYTDEETFLDHLQRNPRIRPYEFWLLVADSTIIVQHLCSVVIFICCFTGIFQERVSPQTVVGWATIGTVAGWVLRDFWQSRDVVDDHPIGDDGGLGEPEESSSTSSVPASGSTSASAGPAEFGAPFREQSTPLYATSMPSSKTHSRAASNTSTSGFSSAVAMPNAEILAVTSTSTPAVASCLPAHSGNTSPFSPRMQERLATAKSAILIYCSLLGLSPILKSLTMSTSSDSIWALSSWLIILNVFTFDYGAGPEAKFPASLSTNAALMASTVLASRLPTTTHVFSLTLFSIEVFGLFPVFRRHLRHHSWTGHIWLTCFLVLLASGGLSMTISGGGYVMGLIGVVLGGLVTCLSMGMTSWWLIGLQRYKNEIHGPWDPARPVIRGRGGWD
ncbi:phosphatidylinositol N-acetylglucosaminyltransferase GPI2 subunit-like [Teratosphaeria destructans]|uniref:Phosphatidylinositol N-acetylglucosaminyltransferase GPI2 subunit-like n=1 Tax=Teratosphaeria destructans TaxID=418781 RepID=A0A9W7SJJ5_9PEZI|nr:phosphatidylinositol N-acetylglucosaminyltransferase GPI2 subunit-like [Teratosphaeria destructans]